MVVSRGGALVLFGVALFVSTMAVGAVTAPDRTIGRDGPPGPATPTPGETPTPGTDRGTAAGTPDESGTPAATPTPERARTLVGMQGSWTDHGSVFVVAGQEEQWRIGGVDSYFEVSYLENGNVAAAFANDGVEENCAPYDPPCSRTGYHVIDPDAPGGPEVVSEYTYTTRFMTNRETHAVDAVPGGGFVFTDMDHERVVLVENGSVAWQWNASEEYEAPPDPTRRDWLHINDVDVIDDERFIVSVRNANQILIVERGEGVVEVINEDDHPGNDDSCTEGPQLSDFDGDGDVQCGDPDVINHQHNPQWLGDGAVLVADSDNDRVVELHRTANGSWEPRWVLSEAGSFELDWPRDADRLPNGNTLITNSLGRQVLEVNPNGTVVWSIGTDRIPYEADRIPYGELAGGYRGDEANTPADTAPPDGTPPADGTTSTPTSGESGTPTQTALPQLTADDPSSLGETGSDVPLLSLAVAGLKGLTPLVPFWFGEFHMGVTLLAVAFVLAGTVDAVWRRYRG